MKVTLNVWRQENRDAKGEFKTYEVAEVPPEASFLEMLDILNEELERKGDPDGPIVFEHDCREGICGSCGFVIDGTAHGPERGATACQLHMRSFQDGDEIWLEPWRAKAFPIVKDLMVDRSAFDRIVEAGGYVSVNTGNAIDANAIPVGKNTAELAFDAATCIGCGACVAACPNASAMLFTSAKAEHLNMLPQGQPERYRRVLKMVNQMDQEDFGHCSNHMECEAVCPKGISIKYIAMMNKDLRKAKMQDFSDAEKIDA